jgi:hypothetical protein
MQVLTRYLNVDSRGIMSDTRHPKMQTSSIIATCFLWAALGACNRDFSDSKASNPHSSGTKDNDKTSAPETQLQVENDADTEAGRSQVDTVAEVTAKIGPEGNSPDWSAGLDAVYDFEKSGLDLGKDTSGNGHHLQLTGMPAQGSDHQRGAFDATFDDSEMRQYLYTGDDFARTLDQPSFTVGTWVRTQLETTNLDYAVVTNGEYGKGGFALAVRLDLDAVRCLIFNGVVEPVQIDHILVADYRDWHHVVCRYDSEAKSLQYFVDGVASEATQAVPEGIGQGTGQLIVGRGFTGDLDEVFFVKRKLSDEQVARIWACGVNGKACSCSSDKPTEYETCGAFKDCETAPLPPCNTQITE